MRGSGGIILSHNWNIIFSLLLADNGASEVWLLRLRLADFHPSTLIVNLFDDGKFLFSRVNLWLGF